MPAESLGGLGSQHCFCKVCRKALHVAWQCAAAGLCRYSVWAWLFDVYVLSLSAAHLEAPAVQRSASASLHDSPEHRASLCAPDGPLLRHRLVGIQSSVGPAPVLHAEAVYGDAGPWHSIHPQSSVQHQAVDGQLLGVDDQG